MLPWGHASVGYLCYTLYTHVRHHRAPLGPAVVAVAIGTQFPDLIDKVLAWEVGLLPSGRSLTHSLLTVAVVAGLLYWAYRNRTELAIAGAFVVGWTSHLFADGYPVLFGEATCIEYLLWPLTICPYEEGSRSIIEFLLAVELADGHLFGIGLTAVASTVWLLDGAPGLGYLRDKAGALRE